MINGLILFFTFVLLALLSRTDWLNRLRGSATETTRGGGVFLDFTFTDCLRGVAILLVFQSHVCSTMGTVIFTPLGGTGVALFLFLSGYGLNESYKHTGLSHYWRKKVARVAFPYFLLISAEYIFQGRNFLSLDYALDIFCLKTTHWYIAFMVKWYIVFWVTSRFFPRWRGHIMVGLGLVMLFFFPNIEAEQAFSFVTGYFASMHIDKLRTLSKTVYAKCGITALAIGIICLAVKQLPTIRELEDTFVYNIVQAGIKLPLALSLVAGLTFAPGLKRSWFLMLCGTLSYEIYLLHIPFYGYVNGSLALAFGFFAVSLIAAFLFSLLNKRVARVLR